MDKVVLAGEDDMARVSPAPYDTAGSLTFGIGQLKEYAKLREPVREGWLSLRSDFTEHIHQMDVPCSSRAWEDILAENHCLDGRLQPSCHDVSFPSRALPRPLGGRPAPSSAVGESLEKMSQSESAQHV